VWEDVLGHADFTVHDWFFDVGGDSILLLRAHKIINRKLSSRELTAEDLYTYPTIAELASRLRSKILVEGS
jgi:phosphopantetheine binding protein